MALVFVATTAVLGIGQTWRAGWLLPQPSGWPGDIVWQVNNLIIYSPLFIVVAARRQTAGTVYVSARGLPIKLSTGLLPGILAVATFRLLQGDPKAIATTLTDAGVWRNLRNFVPVFLEGVAIAFAFVRLGWALGRWPALLVPALLFAAAHIPRQMESAIGPGPMAAYFMVTAGITVLVLWTLERSRDVIWLGIVHYLMDVAIGAFASSDAGRSVFVAITAPEPRPRIVMANRRVRHQTMRRLSQPGTGAS